MKNGTTITELVTITNVKTLSAGVHELTCAREGKEDISLVITGIHPFVANKLKGDDAYVTYLYGTTQCVGLGHTAANSAKPATKKKGR